MKKFMVIAGNRPQLIKASVLLKNLKCIFVYSGQHYSKEMKNVFFKGLHIRKPDYDLKETELGRMIDAMMIIMAKEKPDYIIVYGDTRTTLAGAIAATYVNVPVIHIEAGCRSYNQNQVEERIRVLVDNLALIHFTPSALNKEYLDNQHHLNVFNVGATQIDTMHHYAFPTKKPKNAYKYCVATIHRAENLFIEKLSAILLAFADSGKEIRLYVHPNTEKFIKANKIKIPKNVKMMKPLPYKEMINEIAFADKIITDSGGLQVEAYYLLRPCLTLRDETEWTETVEFGRNILVGTNYKKILENLNKHFEFGKDHTVYGSGSANDNIKLILENL